MVRNKLNVLPVPTFERLGVNCSDLDIEISYDVRRSLTAENNNIIRTNVNKNTESEINIPENTNSSVIMDISRNEKIFLDTKINLGNNSHAKIVQIFEKNNCAVSEISFDIPDDSSAELVQIYIGGNNSVSEIHSILGGRNSRFCADIGYILGSSEKLDLNLIAKHYGKKTRSEITAKGILNNGSQKIFKGTIDFIRGSAGASGTENEDVLLLGNDIVNKTVPLILCSEEDVNGSHGASVGRIDEKHVFYLMSRGIPEEKITRMIAEAKLRTVIDKIDDEQTRTLVNSLLGQGVLYE